MSRIPLIQLPAPRAERPNDPLEEKTFKEEVLFNSSFVKMVRDDIKLPDGGLSKRLYLTHGGACAMVALGDDGTILLERQWRHPLKRSFWELPAGKIDPNEEEIACAKRELIEECGVQAQEWNKQQQALAAEKRHKRKLSGRKKKKNNAEFPPSKPNMKRILSGQRSH